MTLTFRHTELVINSLQRIDGESHWTFSPDLSTLNPLTRSCADVFQRMTLQCMAGISPHICHVLNSMPPVKNFPEKFYQSWFKFLLTLPWVPSCGRHPGSFMEVWRNEWIKLHVHGPYKYIFQSSLGISRYSWTCLFRKWQKLLACFSSAVRRRLHSRSGSVGICEKFAKSSTYTNTVKWILKFCRSRSRNRSSTPTAALGNFGQSANQRWIGSRDSCK